MSKIAFALLALIGMTSEGYASQYSANVMRDTIKARVSMGHIAQDDVRAADVYIAVIDCSRLGEMGWIAVNDNAPEIYIVVDCARRDDGDGTRSWMEQNNIIAELDHRTAVRYGVAGRGGVRVRLWSVE